MEIKVKAKELQIYLSEIFGSDKVEPLLLKNISQKTKFHLKKLGNQLIEEQKAVQEQVKSLVAEFYTEEIEVTQEDGTTKTDKIVPSDRKEEFEAKVMEINELELPLTVYNFTETDFIDHSTKEVVACNNYINLIDLLVYSDKEQ